MAKMIQVRSVPDRLHRELTRRARARGQTLTDYIQEILEREVARPPAVEVFARIESRRPVALAKAAADLVRDEREKSRGVLSIVVLDASAALEYLFGTPSAPRIGATLRAIDVDLHVPALCDIEVLSGVRRALATHALEVSRAEEAVQDYLDLPLTRHGHQLLLPRMLVLRENFSAYDAAYVALAEELRGDLLTADVRLARAARQHTALAIISEASAPAAE